MTQQSSDVRQEEFVVFHWQKNSFSGTHQERNSPLLWNSSHSPAFSCTQTHPSCGVKANGYGAEVCLPDGPSEWFVPAVTLRMTLGYFWNLM